MECSNCSGKFDKAEAVPVYGSDAHPSQGNVVAHECPMCGDELSVRFTRERNISMCAHNATVDRSDGVEVCSNCGAKFGRYGERTGLKTAWATPSDT